MRKLVWAPVMVALTAGLTMAGGPFANMFPDHQPIKSKAFNVGKTAAPVPATPSKISLTGILSKFNIPGLYQTQPMPGSPAKPASRPQLGLQKFTPANSGLSQQLVPLSSSASK